MPAWDEYPEDYRAQEVNSILRWSSSGECAAVIGLSGSGKSNLLSFLANRNTSDSPLPSLVLADCNRLVDKSSLGFFYYLARAIEPEIQQQPDSAEQSYGLLQKCIRARLDNGKPLSILLDRFDALYGWEGFTSLADNLRALRDEHKFRLTYVIAARRLMDEQNELAELFFGHIIWLGPLARSDALWSARRDLHRMTGQEPVWDQDAVLEAILTLSYGYPSLLRALCEAYADGDSADIDSLSSHPAVRRRVNEFWADHPQPEYLRNTGLDRVPLLSAAANLPDVLEFDTTELTAKEHLLLEYLIERKDLVCEKDELIRAVWPEDVIFEQGVRDESLAQLVRRLRVKIEPDPANPQIIHTVPGRGYLLRAAASKRSG